MNHLAQAVESNGRLLPRTLVGVLGVDAVDEQLLVLRQVGELSSIATPNVFAPCAQPDRFVLEVALLLVIQVAAVQIMLPPPIIVSFLSAREISEAQA